MFMLCVDEDDDLYVVMVWVVKVGVLVCVFV